MRLIFRQLNAESDNTYLTRLSFRVKLYPHSHCRTSVSCYNNRVFIMKEMKEVCNEIGNRWSAKCRKKYTF